MNMSISLENRVAEIKCEIIALYKNWDGEDIDDFKYLYGNHDNSIYYYQFEIESRDYLDCIAYITKCVEDTGLEADHSVLKRVSSYEGLKAMLLYWVMEDIDFTNLPKIFPTKI